MNTWALADYLTENRIVPDLNKVAVHRILARHQHKPHKMTMRIHPPGKIQNPTLYIQQVRQLSSVIRSAQDLYASGIQIISLDEKPGVKAWGPVNPDYLPFPGSERKREMFYTRYGSTDLIQGLNLATGELFTPYLREQHKEQEFAEALKLILLEQLRETPDDEIIIICDNFSTHKSESAVRLVASLLGISEKTLGGKQKYGVLKSVKTREAFLTDLDHKIRFLYTSAHASWLNPVECYFSILNRHLLKNGAFYSVEELREKKRAYSRWYNNYLAKPLNTVLRN